jgi:glycosyltransferase involved in cell wall biosynthesis
MEEKKRILILPSWYPPDGGYFFREHSEAIHSRGWQTDVLVNRLVGVRKLIQAGPMALRRFRIARENGLRVVRGSCWKLPGNEKYNIEAWARRTLRIFRKYEKLFGRPALVVAHSVTWAGYAAYLIGQEYGIPYVIVEHRSFFVWTAPEARQMVKPFHIPIFRKAFLHCEKLVLVSESMSIGIHTLVPEARDRCLVIPNMIREDLFFPPSQPRGSDPFVYLWAGRLEHVKGLDLLLIAVKMLSERTEEEFMLRLAGKGSLREELEQRCKTLGIQDRVSFLGRLSREKMLEEMQAANCFVLPSRYEAFGVVLIEAMATGLPVIATRSGGPDSIVNAQNGLLIERDDAEELASAMQRMWENIGAYSPGEIRRQVLLRYGDRAVMNQYHQLFLNLLDSGKVIN